MFNAAILRAWPNYFIVPLMVLMWVVVAVLAMQVLGAKPWHSESISQ
jgi:hypothetical protein